MDLIDYYLIFALTTGISSCYEFLMPAITKAKADNITNTFTESPWLSYCIFTLVTTICAPFTFIPIMLTSANISFRRGVERVVMEPNK
jgi:uncharacterized membrane protein YdjX (TVP38/TMEM64 family)